MSSENLKPCVKCGALIDKKSKVCPECGEKRPFLKKLKLKPLGDVNYAKEILALAALRIIVAAILIFVPFFKVYQTSLFISFVVYGASAYGLYYNRRWGFLVFGLYSIIIILLNAAYGDFDLPFWDLLMIYYAYKGYTNYNVDEAIKEKESSLSIDTPS